jgi:transcriptional regulator with XRE-family HTH domain
MKAIHCFVLVMQKSNEYLLAIGNNIRRLRNEKGISQQELADNSNIAKSTVQRIENGSLNPTILMLNTISESLSTSLEELIKVK